MSRVCEQIKLSFTLKNQSTSDHPKIGSFQSMVDARKGKRIRTLSLFSGAGGLDIGFHQAGYEILACVELSTAYCETLRANSGEGKFFSEAPRIFCEDIRKFDAGQFIGSGIECIIGGPPCQTFSAAGRRSGGVLGTSDERGQLFKVYCEILRTIGPKVFVFENVYGLPGANGGEPWREIVAAFSSLGYTIRAEVLDAADYGVPQHRERLIMVGSRTGDFIFPLPTHGPDSVTDKPLVSVGEAIADLQDSEEPYHSNFGGMYGHLLPLVPEGLNYSFFTAEMGYPEPVFAWRSKFHDLLYKVDPKNPSRTIKAHPGKFTGPFHWKNRHFSLQELKRIQSFPDEYEIVGSYGRVVEQIGNSVPPTLARVIATAVREQLITPVASLEYPVRPPHFKSSFRRRQRERNAHFHAVARLEIARRFPASTDRQLISAGTERRYAAYNGFFEKRDSSVRPKARNDNERVYSIKSWEKDSAVFLDFKIDNRDSNSSIRAEISINGLAKYLSQIDQLNAEAIVRDSRGLFHLWRTIEEVLVSKSRFLTLIDIYGHYANRGDTVVVTTSFETSPKTPLERGLLFFSQSAHCGAFYSRSELQDILGLGPRELDMMIVGLREMRYDCRTSATHPTIGFEEVICTYPFPLLSVRAHLERRLQTTQSLELPALR